MYLEENGLKVSRGYRGCQHHQRPSSTKNKDKARDPDETDAQRQPVVFLGMKTHIGVDSKTRHLSVVVTPANA